MNVSDGVHLFCKKSLAIPIAHPLCSLLDQVLWEYRYHLHQFPDQHQLLPGLGYYPLCSLIFLEKEYNSTIFKAYGSFNQDIFFWAQMCEQFPLQECHILIYVYIWASIMYIFSVGQNSVLCLLWSKAGHYNWGTLGLLLVLAAVTAAAAAVPPLRVYSIAGN